MDLALLSTITMTGEVERKGEVELKSNWNFNS